MSDIKMGDVFAMSVTIQSGDGEGYLLFDNNCEYEEEYLAIIFDSNQARAITAAINNHDRLVEENAQLKADKAQLKAGKAELLYWLDFIAKGNERLTQENAQLKADKAELLSVLSGLYDQIFNSQISSHNPRYINQVIQKHKGEINGN